MDNKLTIIVPARNEEKVVLKTLNNLDKEVTVPHEIIVIDDCSTDNTKNKILGLKKIKRNLRIVSTKKGENGFANAVKLGVKNAKGKFVVLVMADLCDNPNTINRMYKEIIKGWDVVCGCRYMKEGEKIGGPKLQNFLSFAVCKSLHFLTRIPTQDASNAFKMYRKEVLKNLTFNSQSGVEVSIELIFQAYFRNAKIVDVPTTWHGRTIGSSKFKLAERSSKYLRIYIWALKNSLRKVLFKRLS